MRSSRNHSAELLILAPSCNRLENAVKPQQIDELVAKQMVVTD
nr:hypothetical protein [Bartonella choladocola]